MRRKQRIDLSPDAIRTLGPGALRPAPVDALEAPYPLRKREYERWIEARNKWIERRESYSLEHGWPGGDAARQLEENATHPVPDAPFDPAWEVTHGGL